MIEKHIVLEDIDPVIFYGPNNAHIQMIKALFPKLRIVHAAMSSRSWEMRRKCVPSKKPFLHWKNIACNITRSMRKRFSTS